MAIFCSSEPYLSTSYYPMIFAAALNSILSIYSFLPLLPLALLLCCTQKSSIEKQHISYCDSLLQQGDFESAANYYQQEIKQINLSDGNDSYYKNLEGLIEVRLLQQQHESAAQLLDTLTKLQVLRNDTLQITFAIIQAEILYQKRKFDEALDTLNKYEDRINTVSDKLKMRFYLVKGSIYRFAKNDYIQAEQLLLQAKNILEKLNSVNAYWVRLYYRLAATARLKGDFDLAITYGNRMLHFLKEQPVADSTQYTAAYSIIGNTYASQELYANSIPYYDSVLLLTPKNQNPFTLAAMLSNSAFAQQQNNNATVALETYKQALQILKKANAENLSDVHQNLAYLFRELNHVDSALYYYRKCKNYRNQKYPSPSLDKGITYHRYADLLYSLDKLDSSSYYINRALSEISDGAKFSEYENPGMEKIMDSQTAIDLLVLKGKIFAKRYQQYSNVRNLQAAANSFVLANRLLQQNAHQFFSEGSQLININHFWREIINGIDILYALYKIDTTNNTKPLFDFITTTKSQLLLSNQRGKSLEEIFLPEPIIKNKKQQTQQLAYWQARYAMSDNEVQKRKITGTIDSLQTLVKNYEQYLLDNFNAYAKAKQPNNLSLIQIQKQLRETDKTIVEYCWGNRFVYALLISPEKLEIKQLASKDSILQNINRLLAEIKQPQFSHQAYERIASDLYRQLLKPFFGNTPPDDLQIVADNALLKIPFDALVIDSHNQHKSFKDLDYLLKHSNVTHSLSILAPESIEQHTVVQNIAGFAYGNEVANRYSLPNTKIELAAIENRLNGNFYYDRACNRENFFSQMATAQILHVAVHGAADTTNRFTSKLLFPSSDAEEKIYSYELYKHSSVASLVVLSACESGLGSQENGEGVFSITRAFITTGAKGVIQSLWNLHDALSTKVITQFYDELIKGHSISGALNKSKLQYLSQADAYTAHPAYWAGLTFVGNDQVLVLKTKKAISDKLLIAFLVLSVCGLAIIFRKRLISFF